MPSSECRVKFGVRYSALAPRNMPMQKERYPKDRAAISQRIEDEPMYRALTILSNMRANGQLLKDYYVGLEDDPRLNLRIQSGAKVKSKWPVGFTDQKEEVYYFELDQTRTGR